MGPNGGSGLVFNGAVATAGNVSTPCVGSQALMFSFQTKLTGSAASVVVDIQVSNVPGWPDSQYYLGQNIGGGTAIPTTRDDSYASSDWVTVSTNTMNAAVGSRMDVVAYSPAHRVMRVRLLAVPTSTASNTNAYVYYRATGF